MPSSQPSSQPSSEPSSQPSSQPSLSLAPSLSRSEDSCEPKDGDEAACTNASPIIRRDSCIGGRACVNTDLVQSIGIGSCNGTMYTNDVDQKFGVCENSAGQSISIGDGSWYVYFFSTWFLSMFYFFRPSHY
jgi:hypothetical protein